MQFFTVVMKRAYLYVGFFDLCILKDDCLFFSNCLVAQDMAKLHIDGSITYPRGEVKQQARVCIGVGKERPVCAVGKDSQRTGACRDACACACREVVKGRGRGLFAWFIELFRTRNCAATCRAACVQPGRVSQSQFSGPL